MSTGLTIETARGTVEVPRAIEADGPAAVAAFVEAFVNAPSKAPVTPAASSAPPSEPEE